MKPYANSLIVAAYGGGINGCHYAASKGGLSSMMKNLSAKLAPLNISVNDVAPALIGETGMVSSPDVIPGGVATIPMGRLGSPQEVANVVTSRFKFQFPFRFGILSGV